MSGKLQRAEDRIQRAVVEYLQHLANLGRLDYFAVPNGGRRSKIEAAIMVGLGVRKGVPDLVILLRGGGVVFIELKQPRGELSPHQELWRDRLQGLGFAWHTADNVADAVAIIDALPGVRRAV